MPKIRNPRQRTSSARSSRLLDADFIDGIRRLIADARTTVARGVDLLQVHTNFEIGRRIVNEEQRGENRAAYGEEIIRALAGRLTGEFGNGFSKSNLEYMRRFYLAYSNRVTPIAQTTSGQFEPSEITQTLSGQSDQSSRPFTLSWSHYV